MTNKKDEIVATAIRLFSQHGVFATGVDRLMAESGISKRTLYKYFPTKEHLIVEVVKQYHHLVEETWGKVLNTALSGKEKILGIFEMALSNFENASFNGCMAINVMAEYHEKNKDIENACSDFKRWELSLLEDLTKQAGQKNYKEIAFQLFVLLEGIFSTAKLQQQKPPRHLLALAEELIEKK
ncbi:MAG: TetR/AcrR family transcriptional regulator [Bdellovibrionales bacterium]|nr:TetR/AcrR family transcriptional regulator [Bdellovibrionales bacterium]